MSILIVSFTVIVEVKGVKCRGRLKIRKRLLIKIWWVCFQTRTMQ